jgi:hypothetical protein
MDMTGDPEVRLGIKTQTTPRPSTLAQKYSLIAGVVYLLFGVMGFFRTGVSAAPDMMNDMLFGTFMINPFHNVVHVTVGVLWLLGAFALSPAGTEGLNIALGAFWALTTILGFLGYLSALAVMSGTTPDTFLHLGTAVMTLIFGTGLIPALRSSDRPAAA